ncbi:anaerobic ribonucleoside-triphosphate reductase activating protein [Aerococcus sp. UMB7834]|uniref:anaerobic ribonucleoside-triphosphate reductase activating protein n=1 Tax=Aerococcus sp. UMB7834 TaxID=3046342 RepID=UPI00254ACB38|nr:anaerobic ribonucleoside-triphosphate reductase activating protein [Aerococcus sp. UMB7834]MDK6804766.1 anaerobic ribonucleoside-triphosphate reductase activating protein [Aerococcus sp. UMB7834]
MRNPKPKEWTAEKFSKGKIADYKPFNFVDGDGVRCSIYVSGCPFACKGCYNKIVQNFNYGVDYTDELEERILNDLAQPYVQGLTLLGGEPFLNTQVLNRLVAKVRERFGDSKDIWSWSGYYWEELLQETDDKLWLLNHIDVLVDGRFELDKLDLNLRFRGSSNQRIIDVKKSLAQGEMVLWLDGKYDDI